MKVDYQSFPGLPTLNTRDRNVEIKCLVKQINEGILMQPQALGMRLQTQILKCTPADLACLCAGAALRKQVLPLCLSSMSTEAGNGGQEDLVTSKYGPLKLLLVVKL